MKRKLEFLETQILEKKDEFSIIQDYALDMNRKVAEHDEALRSLLKHSESGHGST
jgi:hypothetical protein